MSSLSSKDRVSLCSFTFSDGRRCRTPRTRNHPHFCFYHAQKEARASAAQKLGKDLDYFFSGDYLSACDLSTNTSTLSAPTGGAKPSATPSTATRTTASRPLPNPNSPRFPRSGRICGANHPNLNPQL